MSKHNWGVRACGAFVLCATAAVALPAQTLTTLHSFDGPDGATPYAGLVQATDGNFYGTTYEGGVTDATGPGTVFEITPSGTLTTLYIFCSQSNCIDGQAPEAGLVQATDGNFYGTTVVGGTNDYGTVFKITPSGARTTLHNFDMTDGANPDAGLVQATNGNFYGTTVIGGSNTNSSCPYGCGTVFKITANGTLTTLHNFDGTDGAYPEGGLVQGTNGDFYGTTDSGGAHDRGFGTVFQITPSGRLTTLHNFDGTDGEGPAGGVVQGIDGNFYGTASRGGANHNTGTVFTITPSGTFTTLYNFCSQSNCTDGNNPPAGLIQATDGNFYGTTYQGGANSTCFLGCGTVFKITPGGTLTTLYNFCSQSNCTDGNNPYGVLVQATDGSFYGTASRGGGNTRLCYFGCGTVFNLSVGLGPFVETLPASGKVGTAVHILGTSLTGATSVTFNGTVATFTVKSKSEITTTVPAGATTGTVQVLTPGGTLPSNIPFTVKP